MRAPAALRAIFFTSLLVAGLAYGCGRTSLDDGVISGGGDLGGTSGAGGRGGTSGKAGGGSSMGGSAGVGGIGVVGIPCGAGTCAAGSQVCCTRFVNGQTSQSCVAANNPNACLGGSSAACIGGSSCPAAQVCCVSINTLSTSCAPPAQCANGTQFVLCANDAACPGTLPACCVIQAPALGICMRRGATCAFPPGP